MQSKLPEDIIHQIDKEAEAYAEKENSCYTNDLHGYFEGATEWAQWKVKFDELKTQFDNLQTVYTDLFNTAQNSANKHQQLKERCEKMEAALLSAQRLKTLWAFSEPVSPEHLNKAVALEYMANKIDEALAFKHEGINEKEGEGCPYCGIKNCQSDHK